MKKEQPMYVDIRDPLPIIKIYKSHGLYFEVRQKKRKGANQNDITMQKIHMSCARWKCL